jgi:hypothetical protein
MPEEMNLEDLYEWAAENLDKIIEDVQTILHNNPNGFVSIREIGKKLNWPFEGYKELDWICLIATCGLEYDQNYEQLEYKYKKEFTDEDKFSDIFIRKREEIRREARDDVLREFKGPRQRRELEEGDRRMEETIKQLIKIQNEERDIREDL